MGRAMSVSVVIPARDESNLIIECVQSVREGLTRARSLVRWAEIYVVDNGSVDSTGRVARRSGCTVIDAAGISVGACRNAGAAATRGEVLAFVDADVRVPLDFFASLLLLIEKPEVGIAGLQYGLGPNPTVVERAWQCQRPCSDRMWSLPAGAILMRRTVFTALGGFSETLTSGEDTDLCARAINAGLEIRSDPALLASHLGNAKSLQDVFRKQIWQGAGMWEGAATLRMSGTKTATLLFGASLMLGAIALAASVAYGSLGLALMGAGVLFGGTVFTAALLTVGKLRRASSAGTAAILLSVYWVYLLARFVSLFWRPGRIRGT